MKPVEHTHPDGIVTTEHLSNAWTVKENGLPIWGIYETEEAAILAVDFNDHELKVLTGRIHAEQGRAITVQDLNDYLKEIQK